MEWGFKEKHVAVIALHIRGKIRFSNFQTLETIENFAKILSIGQLNVIRNSGGLKTGLGQDV